VRIEEKEGVVDVVVDTHCVNAAPVAAKASILGVGMRSPKTASARKESIARSSTFGAAK
jgi:hypothetical protein